MNEKLVTVLTLTCLNEILNVRERFDSEGIESFIQDETTEQVNPMDLNAPWRTKIQVRESDVQKALEILVTLTYIKKSKDCGQSFSRN